MDSSEADRARDLGPVVMGELLATVKRHDPDPVVILVLTGSPEREVAMSIWAAFEGPQAEERALGMVAYAIQQA